MSTSPTHHQQQQQQHQTSPTHNQHTSPTHQQQQQQQQQQPTSPIHQQQQKQTSPTHNQPTSPTNSSTTTTTTTTNTNTLKTPTDLIKEKCESSLQQPDSIMSIEASSLMKEYITVGGRPQDVITFLSESYRGYAQMCNLLCYWLKIAGIPEEQIQTQFSNHLKEIIINKFDPKVADTIFTSSSTPPHWLDEMIVDSQWRSLIYQLSEEHKNCLMLNFIIQRISDSGYQNEIASLSTASTYYRVFNKVLFDSLADLVTLDEISFRQQLDEFKKSCCQHQHTYLYAQATIQNLIKNNPQKAYNLKRISQELEIEATKKNKIAQRISLMMSNISQYPLISSSITSLLMSNTTTTGDIIKLYNEYTKAQPPPVDFLRYPNLLELLLSDLFCPGKVIQSVHKSKWIYLVTYSVCINSSSSSNEKDNNVFKDITRAIEIVHNICQSNPLGSELQSVVGTLKDHLDFPIISMGIMQWIKHNLTDTTNLSSYNTLCVPIYLDFLRDICLRHPLHRSVVLNILVSHFEVEAQDLESLAILEMRKNVIDNIVYLFSCGYVIPVLDTIESWAPKIDPSLTRYFINQVLDIIEPPYSQSFMDKMKSIIKIINPFGESTKLEPSVQSFLDQCKNQLILNNNNNNNNNNLSTKTSTKRNNTEIYNNEDENEQVF
ncbi:TH1 family protein [Dictyostelium discoideum AX4]|uniref:TH1 family protein n=1 Tax=Dictyostelium discoideum TaxID=44689 RepID=Q55F13_DICDI|nr:TH1 family protein [Dictyostelium discoideum AX4]EAL72928.1 TH1 family protein [Dictyostelium discoideum AX4]|eukprot:XP_646857.1 TH1 family protein [Dictyostelium discoideum AX4]